MADTSTSNNFFVKFSPKSGFATKRLSLWKEWTYFTIQDVQRVLLCNFVHCFYRRFHVRLGYEPLSFLFLEQCFQLNLLDLFNPQMYFFDTDNLPMTWKMLIYSLSIICSIISPTRRRRREERDGVFGNVMSEGRGWELPQTDCWPPLRPLRTVESCLPGGEDRARVFDQRIEKQRAKSGTFESTCPRLAKPNWCVEPLQTNSRSRDAAPAGDVSWWGTKRRAGGPGGRGF